MTTLAQHAVEHHIQSNPLLKHGSPQFLEQLYKQVQTLQVHKGHIFFFREDQAESFYIILNGWVKLFRESANGSQAVIDVFTAGHTFGENALFEDMTHPYSAEAVETVQLIKLPTPLLKKEIEANPKVAMAMLHAMSRYRNQQDMELEHRTLQSAPQRIGCFLLKLLPEPQSTSPQSIQLPYDKTLVSSRLGMQPETFSRALSKLKAEAALEVRGSQVIVTDVTKLANFCCSACSTIFPCHD